MVTAVGCTCAESAQLGVSPCVLFRHNLAGHNTLKCNYNSATEAEFTWKVDKKVPREPMAYIFVKEQMKFSI